jgi:hypothetical protein
LLRYARNDGGPRSSLRGNTVTEAIYYGLHNQRIEQAELFIQVLHFLNIDMLGVAGGIEIGQDGCFLIIAVEVEFPGWEI